MKIVFCHYIALLIPCLLTISIGCSNNAEQSLSTLKRVSFNIDSIEVPEPPEGDMMLDGDDVFPIWKAQADSGESNPQSRFSREPYYLKRFVLTDNIKALIRDEIISYASKNGFSPEYNCIYFSNDSYSPKEFSKKKQVIKLTISHFPTYENTDWYSWDMIDDYFCIIKEQPDIFGIGTDQDLRLITPQPANPAVKEAGWIYCVLLNDSGEISILKKLPIEPGRGFALSQI